MSDFTPGPWLIDTGMPKRGSVIVARTGKSFPETQFVELADVRDFANARLIAAAPTMADLLMRWANQGLLPELTQETRDVLTKAGVI
jgi:hypothetical protein